MNEEMAKELIGALRQIRDEITEFRVSAETYQG